LPNVFVSPHNAGSTRGFRERGIRMFVENLERWCRGEALVNEVRPPAATGAKP
jgi:phosphoglycerate dehydrogenase-like enzyme